MIFQTAGFVNSEKYLYRVIVYYLLKISFNNVQRMPVILAIMRYDEIMRKT